MSIKHWLFSKTQCSVEYSYPSGSGDSRFQFAPLAAGARPQRRYSDRNQEIMEVLFCMSADLLLGGSEKWLAQPPAIEVQLFGS